ncbi:unnamed protein product [Litomosoides sigmodontis]|uniref:Uncharacterized protein n=1 Tax=Litomosoides sigmodontis TaxID=42156 RepID=A0A3P6TCM4_LITSI|nr:unnamed protein product [Litomosoides sigmodontis]
MCPFVPTDVRVCVVITRVPAQRPSKLSGAAGLSPGGGQNFAHILETLEGSSLVAEHSFGMTNARGSNSSTTATTASSGVLMVGPNFKV